MSVSDIRKVVLIQPIFKARIYPFTTKLCNIHKTSWCMNVPWFWWWINLSDHYQSLPCKSDISLSMSFSHPEDVCCRLCIDLKLLWYNSPIWQNMEWRWTHPKYKKTTLLVWFHIKLKQGQINQPQTPSDIQNNFG